MLDFLFGWRKASKCKRLIRQVQCRLVMLKNKRCSIVRQLRQDVAELIKLGHGQIAFSRVEQIYKDERIIEVYELLEHFCDFIIINLSYIRRHKDCPNDISEAISSLIFASARCGDIPELRKIRKLFGERYGQKLVMSALELLPSNHVNSQIRSSLSIKSVAEDVKIRLMNEISRDCCFHGHSESPLALKYNSEWHQQQAKEDCRDGKMADQYSSAGVEENEVLCITLPASIINSPAAADPHCCSPIKAPGKQEKFVPIDSPDRSTFLILASSSHTSDELVQCLEENVVYLDDIQEFRSPESKDINLLDQRVFVFKSLPLPMKDLQADESSKRTGSRASGRGSRKRSLSREYLSFKNISYYGNKSSGTCSNGACDPHQRRKQLRNNLEHPQEASKTERASIRAIKCSGSSSNPNCSCGRSNPCCCPSTRAAKAETSKCSNQRMMLPIPSSSQSSQELSKGIGSEIIDSDFYTCSDSASWRSISTPSKRHGMEQHNHFVRHSSLPVQPLRDGNHVHPKLPDYKELESTFLALKTAYLLDKNP